MEAVARALPFEHQSLGHGKGKELCGEEVGATELSAALPHFLFEWFGH